MTTLRPYQRAALDALRDYWAQGGGNPLIEMATGTGKSIVIATLVRELLQEFPDLRVLMLVHVRELVEQNAKAMLRLWPDAPIGVNCAGLGKRDRRHQIIFASVQSVHRQDLGPRDLVLIDEAHLVPQAGEGMYLRLLEKLRAYVPDMRVAGFTATPYRLDSGRLDEGDGRLFDDVAYTYGIADGVADGWLSPLVAKGTATKIDVSGVARRGGEFVAGDLERAANTIDVVEGACDEIVARGADRRGWLVFCSGIKHATAVQEALRARGVACECITSDTPACDRDRFIKSYRAGTLRCLTNANVLTTGFDAPHVDLIAMLRPTLSTGLYVQSLGRGTRIADNKADCLVLDFAGNVRRHGPVDTISVSGRSHAKDGEAAVKPDSVRAKICPECDAYVALNALSCVYCGHEWPKPEPKHKAVADVAPIMASRGAVWIDVTDVVLHRHEKPGSPPSLRVEYECGFQIYREWITLEHAGYAQARAQTWWSRLGGLTPAPRTVDEALKRAGELEIPKQITIARDGKFWRVTGYRTTHFEIDQRLKVRPLQAVA